MPKNKKILLALLRGGASQSTVAAALHVSKRDVSAAAAVIRERGLTLADVEPMAPADVDGELFPRAPRKRSEAYLPPDVAALVERRERNPKLPVKFLWAEYREAASSLGLLAYSYQAFCEMFAEEAQRTGAARHFAHAPGEKAYVDWAGDAARVTDRVTGKSSKVYVMVVALPCSGYFWAGGFADMRQQSWLLGHMEAFEAFGGVPRILVPDNCATAVDRGPARATRVNADYERFAEHYGTAVVPARVRAPRDKAAAESTVNLVEQWVVAPSRELVFYTLAEFNEYCAERVAWLNARPFSGRDGSRDSEFAGLEAPELLPLPPERFELCEWRRCKVAPDYHVRVDYMHYSVPHALIGREVDVRLTAERVEVLDSGERVAGHPRLRGRKNQYSTDPAHMPPSHALLESPWSRGRFESWAAGVGPETAAAVGRLLASRAVVEQSFVPCRNVLGLSKQYGSQALERACAAANASGCLPSYTGLKNAILAARQAGGQAGAAPSAPAPAPVDNAGHAGLTRGADAYRRERGGSGC